ncbi:hypothetical protein ACIBK1_07495 [Microbispora rosea]|uniref:hypothetical protein n=1 Tax=Microbispora rosea TaxID=58117 RepID=UPI0037B3D7AB
MTAYGPRLDDSRLDLMGKMHAMSMGRLLRVVAAAFTLVAVLAACTQREGGAVSIMRSNDGAPSVAVTWCDDSPPRQVTVFIEERESEKPVAKFTTAKGRDHFTWLDPKSPGSDWILLSGHALLVPGVTYRLMAWPDAGKDMSYGQVSFTLADFDDLKPGQIAGGYPGETFTKSEFMKYARDICG